MNPLRKYALKVQQDPHLQTALNNNATRRQGAWVKAFESLDHVGEMRRQARDRRTHTIQNLPHYLEMFCQKAAANVWKVHNAKDAPEANRIVLEIAQKHQARLAAKSKSMLSEELNINQALEAVDIQVVETDLGEYIIQLRGERPSHLITPALHLQKEDVARLFHEKLGEPLEADIPTMTLAARKALREIFLKADIGISGVNFGVAETGAVCLVTNEGNGRMVTTLPRVHIALMGIERLAPTLQDLALYLELLPRSSTGQKLTVYTQLIRQPRQPGELDGAQERHLVLVDNGRSLFLGTPLEEALHCIRCGACLNICPVFQNLSGHGYLGLTGKTTPYTGPIGSVLSAGMFGKGEFTSLARASSLCGACEEVCPVGIPLPRLLLQVRAGHSPAQTQPAETNPAPQGIPQTIQTGLKAFAWAAARPGAWRLAQKSAAAAAKLVSPSKRWMPLPHWTGWGTTRNFPRPALQTFQERFPHIQQQPSKIAPSQPTSAKNLPLPGHNLPTTPDYVNQFKQELEFVNGQIISAMRRNLPTLMLDFLSTHNIQDIHAWEAPFLPIGLWDELAAAGVRLSSAPHPSLRAGLTGAQAAVASSGSLLLAGGPGRPQTASLLPEIHLAILNPTAILPTLADALRLKECKTASTISLVTGPSRTADIEMSLTIGVHGPKKLVVFLLED